MKKKNVSIILNCILVVFEIIAFISTIIVHKKIGIQYYTEQSNFLAMCSSLLYIIFISSSKKIPRWLYFFKYISTVCLTLTFFVVILILAPMYNFNYGYLLFHEAMIFVHLLCPIIGIITFIFFDELNDYKKKDSFIGTFYTFLYAFVFIILNVLKVLEGPYPFLMVYKQPIYMSVLWCILILVLSYSLSIVLGKLYVKKRHNQ